MDSEEALIEEEIQRELDKLTEADLESSDNSLLDTNISDTNLSQDDLEPHIPDEFDNYIKSLQNQTSAFEQDLAECDELLHQSIEITRTKDEVFADDLKIEIPEGENIEDMRLQILNDLSKEDVDDEDEDEDLFADSDNEDSTGKSRDNGEQALVSVTKQQLEFRELLTGQKMKVQEEYKKQEEHVNKLIEKERHEEELFEQEIETKRQEIKMNLEREESMLLTARKEREEEEEKQRKMIEKELEEEMSRQQDKIRELEETAKREKEEWEQRVKEEEIRQEKKRQDAATKIQSVYKGFRTRKEYKAEVDRHWSEAQEKRREERIKQIEEERKLFEEEEERQRKKEEEERKRQEELERKKKEEMERKQKEKEEKERKAEEERLRKEEEKRRKEEEKKRKEEEKKRKEEEERIRNEEEKRKKEEEKKRKEEEKRQKEEEAKRKKEEEKQRKREEEERKKKEEIERKQKEELEKQQKLEKERLEKEQQKREKEEQQLKEMEKIRQEELRKSELQRQEDELKRQEEKMKELLNDTEENKSTAKSHQMINGGQSPRVKTPRRSVRRSQDGLLSTAASGNLGKSVSKNQKNGVNIMEGLPSHLEEKRLAWIKACLPWSQVSNEPWKLKSTNTRPVRRPSSAKKLPMLQESVILSAAKMASLRQVTTVELKDLPGSNMSTLGQCTGLKFLKMTNCNLLSCEGLQNCKQLQYLDLKENKIEYVDLKSLGSIKVIDLSQNNLSVIHGMDGCTDVRWLDLSDNKITRIGGLNGLRRLHTLKLARNQLISTSGLGDTPTVQRLDLSHNHLQEVDDINKLCLLQYLNVSSNNLLQVPDLQNHVLLGEIVLEDNNITSVENLNQCWLPLVQKLNISQNSLDDLVSLENLLLLRDLDVSNNQVIDNDVFQSAFNCYIYLETLNMNGNPAVESVEDIQSFRKKLTDSLTRLHKIDSESVSSSQYGSPIKPRHSYESMCLHQVQMMKDSYNRFQQDLKSHLHSSDLASICDIYFKFCDKSYKMAEEHRYAHEYGEISVTQPSAPSTPKSGRPRSARAHKVQQDSYMTPKEMFEKALQDGGGNGSNGIIRGDNVAVVKPVISAKLVQNILEDDPANLKKDEIKQHKAAVVIQSMWRGYVVRKQLLDTFDMSVLQELHYAAVKIQAAWRGYSLRSKLLKALDFARLDDEDEEFGEIDMNDLNFNEDILDDWRPPSTPQIPNSHAVLGKPPSGKKPSPPKIPSLPIGENPSPPQQPRRAWRGMDSPMSDIHQNRPPSSLVSGTDTHRTGLSKKEEKISEEWGFKNDQTAHLMMQRARKMKYNAERRKKIKKLDPKQRLQLFRKMEDLSHYPNVQHQRKVLPRKEYFQERQKEIDNAEREKRIEKNERVNRTFEWLHTQVGDYEISDSCINTNHVDKVRQRFGSDGNLPKLDSDLMSGKPVRLVSSPVDLQSVDSVSLQGEFAKPRRFSAGSSDSQTRLPPIKGGSAPIGQKRKERMSWRNPQNKNADIGWGSGKKRTVH